MRLSKPSDTIKKEETWTEVLAELVTAFIIGQVLGLVIALLLI